VRMEALYKVKRPRMPNFLALITLIAIKTPLGGQKLCQLSCKLARYNKVLAMLA